jgi:hypothetical protein
MGNAFCHSLQSRLSFRPLCKGLNVEIYKTIIVNVEKSSRNASCCHNLHNFFVLFPSRYNNYQNFSTFTVYEFIGL